MTRKQYLVEELRIVKRVVRADSPKQLEAIRRANCPKSHTIVALVIKRSYAHPSGTRSLLHKQDFIEMLERGDSFEEIARVAKVRVASVETRYQRLTDSEKRRIKRGLL